MAFTFQFQPKENARDRVDGPTVEIPDQVELGILSPVLDATNTILRHEEELTKLEQQLTKRNRVTSGR